MWTGVATYTTRSTTYLGRGSCLKRRIANFTIALFVFDLLHLISYFFFYTVTSFRFRQTTACLALQWKYLALQASFMNAD